MKLGFFLPGPFHFIPILKVLLKSRHVSVIVLPSPFRFKRIFSLLNVDRICFANFFFIEVIRKIPNYFGFKYFIKQREIVFFLVFDFFAQWFVSSKLDCVVACSHSALFTLRKAKKKGVITILDVSSAHVLLQNELVNAGYKDLQINETYYSNYLIKRDLLEYDIADRILVPSEFVRNSMISHGIPKNKIIKIPYGVDVKFWKRAQTSKELDSSTIRIIFCGHISIQKGIAPLLAAWDEISTGPRAEQFSLSLCGSIDKNVENLVSGYCKQFSNLRYLGKLNKLALRQVFSEHHALILPSLQDGYGMVLNEALSTGLCVMGSCRTGITELPKCDKVVNFGDPSVRNIVASIYSLSEIISAEDKVNLRDWDDYTSELVSELTKLLEVTHRK